MSDKSQLYLEEQVQTEKTSSEHFQRLKDAWRVEEPASSVAEAKFMEVGEVGVEFRDVEEIALTNKGAVRSM